MKDRWAEPDKVGPTLTDPCTAWMSLEPFLLGRLAAELPLRPTLPGLRAAAPTAPGEDIQVQNLPSLPRLLLQLCLVGLLVTGLVYEGPPGLFTVWVRGHKMETS